MDVVFLVGRIASGKSRVASYLQDLGAWRIDLDQVSRAQTAPGTPCVAQLAEAFGDDIVDGRGALDRRLLARRAFADADSAARLEAIEMPYIRQGLTESLSYAQTVGEDGECVVVEVPLLDRVEDLIPLADEVLYVRASEPVRRERALGRGMEEADFLARQARQPDDGYLEAHATAIIDNDGGEGALEEAVRTWYEGRGYVSAEGGR